MHQSQLLLAAMPMLAVAQQIPILDQVKSFFAPAATSIQSAASAATDSIPNPADLAADAAAAAVLEHLTIDTFPQLPYRTSASSGSSGGGFEEWMVLATGGNKTCGGHCGRVDQEYNKAVARLSVSPSGPRLGKVSCETEGVLCGSWALTPPAILHMLIPHPAADQSLPSRDVRFVSVNATGVTADEIVALHEDKRYLDTKLYEGIWHPFDGVIAKNGLAQPVGYAISQANKIPSWTWMIAISMFTRTFA